MCAWSSPTKAPKPGTWSTSWITAMRGVGRLRMWSHHSVRSTKARPCGGGDEERMRAVTAYPTRGPSFGFMQVSPPRVKPVLRSSDGSSDSMALATAQLSRSRSASSGWGVGMGVMVSRVGCGAVPRRWLVMRAAPHPRRRTGADGLPTASRRSRWLRQPPDLDLAAPA